MKVIINHTVNKIKLKELISISRPKFWIYEAGTFFVGYLLAIKNIFDFLNINFIIFFFYFIFPANLLIYGINDIFDYETDKLNPKKGSYENLLEPKFHKNLIALILLFNLPFLVYSFIRLNFNQIVYFLLFIFFAVFYSSLPIRAKSKPFLDSFFSASHYVFTGIFGYYLIYPDKTFPVLVFIFGILWAMAMHAYSAVPDIEFDSKAEIKTIATFLGDKKTIIFCSILYSISFFLVSIYSAYLLVGLIPYLILMALSIKFVTNKEKLFKIYKIFPYVNTILPMIWSILYMYQKFII